MLQKASFHLLTNILILIPERVRYITECFFLTISVYLYYKILVNTVVEIAGWYHLIYNPCCYPREGWKEAKGGGGGCEKKGTRSAIYLPGNAEQPKNLEAMFWCENLINADLPSAEGV